MSRINKGKLIHTRVSQKIFNTLHKGPITKINAIVVHQTGAPSAQNTFNSYSNPKANGAHFLIDKTGKIVQTALINQKTYHVGKIKSRCLQTKNCTKSEIDQATNLLYAKGLSFGLRIKNLSNHENSKAYPDRYPNNSDSIGIEIVGEFDKTISTFESVNMHQNNALKWLINELATLLTLSTTDDIYRHPDISRKQVSEASTAKWN